MKKSAATGANVFLDLKFHDIPNTVAKAVAAATRLDVQMLTIHTSGGSEMMRAAEKSAPGHGENMRPARAIGPRGDSIDQCQQRNAGGDRLRFRHRKTGSAPGCD